VAAAVAPATEVIDEVARLLGDQVFMAGDALSLADLMLAPHLSFLPHFAEGQAILARHDNLAAWIDRMEARPSMAATTWDRLKALAAREAVAA
jgi:glutathione S-transferase